VTRWVTGDGTGLAIPADPDTLRGAGADFLTAAMRRFGTLAADNTVDRITRFQECGGGSTGRKALLDVEYARPQPGLRTELFVKFSRDFDNPRRDRGKSQMELEVNFALLSVRTDLPVPVPLCVFGDYHRESCTGMLLTERIAYGAGDLESHYDKCLDYTLPNALEHYEALLGSVARLAGVHRSGRLPESVAEQFRFDAEKVSVGKRVRYSADELAQRIRRLVAFASGHPGLLPAFDPALTGRMLADVGRIAAAEDAIMAWLHATEAHIALCHWNANVDNAWFWTTPGGALHNGLMDWGCVSVMNVAMALWGSLCSAETTLWELHLDHLLAHFATEYANAGGPDLDPLVLRSQLMLYIAVMGVAWLLDTPAYLTVAVPDLADVADRYDPRISGDEAVRAPLLMLNNVLHLWATEDFGALIDEVPGH
jgi:hypothetical protein